MKKSYMWIVLGALAVALMVAFVFFFKFSYYPDSACDCEKARELNLLTSPDSASNNGFDRYDCLYRYIYRSGEYEDCKYLGISCVSYLERKGVDCSDMKCGECSLKEMEKESDDALKILMNKDDYTQEEVNNALESLDQDFKSSDEILKEVNERSGFSIYQDYLAKKGCN